MGKDIVGGSDGFPEGFGVGKIDGTVEEGNLLGKDGVGNLEGSSVVGVLLGMSVVGNRVEGALLGEEEG